MGKADQKHNEEGKGEEEVEKKPPNIKMDLDTLDKICSEEPYSINLVKAVVQVFARKYGLAESGQVHVLPMGSSFPLKIKSNFFQKPCFFLLERGLDESKRSWAVLVITKKNESEAEEVAVLHKDFTGGEAIWIEPILNQLIPKGLKLKANNLGGSFPPTESGALSLKWMQMMMEGLMSPEGRVEFISKFSEMVLASEGNVKLGQLKTDLKVDLVKPTIEEMLKPLQVDDETKTSIGKCMEFCKIARDRLRRQVSDYVKVLEEETAELDNDSKHKMDKGRIENARKELQGKLGTEDSAGMEKLIKQAIPQYLNLSEKPKQTDRVKTSEEKAKEEEDEKKPFDVFRRCIRLLKGVEKTDKSQTLLNSIGNKFGVKGEALLEYVCAQAQAKDEIEVEETGHPENMDSLDLDDLLSLLPPMMPEEKSGSIDPQVKSMDQLLAELAEGKEVSLEEGDDCVEVFRQKFVGNQDVLEMKKDYDAVMGHFEKTWKDADLLKIKLWAKAVRKASGLDPDSLSEGIAVMDRVFQLTNGGFRMRAPQLFSLIWFLWQSNKGKLAQISTGEGKTIIIGALASLMVLRGARVDVLTSNEVLAKEGVNEMELFYKILGISVATNNEEKTASKRNRNSGSENPKPRACYSADVVYGTIASFQFDYLRDISEGQVTRGSRPFGVVILDEVDNLSVDNGGNIAKLAKPFPGMECLKYIYIKIWQELAKAEEKVAEDYIKQLDEMKKKLDGKGQKDDGLEGEGNEGDVSEENVLEEERKEEEVLKENAVEGEGKEEEVSSENISERNVLEGKQDDITLEEEYENFQVKLIASFVDKLRHNIKASNPCDIDLIHGHLRPYCESMLEKWIDNALFAKFECQEKEMYIIKEVGGEEVVLPVDYANTGVTLENTQWSNGLHQFVQLKHNLRLTCENLTSSFISNMGYIKLYKSNNIFGLTGTLGSVAERKMLSTAYNVQFKFIPRYKDYNLRMCEGLVVANSRWGNLVTLEAVREAATRKRAVLIICKTIKDLEFISQNVKACLTLEGYEDGYIKVKTYLDENECAVVKEEVGQREIIVATNIAGRGTNFKTSKELEDVKGLHIIVSFLPCNKRVEDQAFGRTARQGNQGSAQLILREQDVLEIDLDPRETPLTMEEILEKRDEIESSRLKNITEMKLSEITFNDELFTKFSELYRDFNSHHGKTLGTCYVAADLKEMWAFWLHEQDYNFDKIKKTGVKHEFDKFTSKAESLLKNCEVMWNPFNEIRMGTMFLHINDLEKGEQAVRRGIEMCGDDDSLCASGYMKLFDIEIEKGAQLMERFKMALANIIWIPLKKDETYKDNAKAALKKAVKGLEKEVDYLNSILTTKGKSHQDFQRILTRAGNNFLLTHLNGRRVALTTFHEHAKDLLKRLEESMEGNENIGLAMGSRIPHYLKKLDEKSSSDDEKKLKEALTSEALDELQWIGLETLYSLRDVHDAQETILGAQIQIGTGLACLAGGFFFPLWMPILGPIAGALISEGICDIVIELLSKGYTGFDVESYVKGKCISVGIALATAGITAITSSVKLMDKAAKACRSLSELLRKCPYLIEVCKTLAGQIDNLADTLIS